MEERERERGENKMIANSRRQPKCYSSPATSTIDRTEHEERTIDVIRFYERAAFAICALCLLTAGQIHQTKSTFLANEALLDSNR